MNPLSYQVRFANGADGVSLAYSSTGSHEPTIVKAATWLSHLEFDCSSPVWRHMLDAMTDIGTLVR